MGVRIAILLFISCGVYSQSVYYCQDTSENASASDANAGTNISLPWASWQHAIETADAGDTVYFRGGTWFTPEMIEHDPNIGKGNNGTYSAPIHFFNYPGESPIIDCINHTDEPNAHGILFRTSTYIKVRGIEIKNKREQVWDHYIATFATYDVGTFYIENCISHDNGGYGFHWYEFDTVSIINCDSYNNYDSLRVEVGNRSDGFAGGNGPVDPADTFKYLYITGCRSWNNSDDGFEVGSTMQCEVFNNWSWNNGNAPYGGGTGFKTSLSYVRRPETRRVHHNLVAFSTSVGCDDLNLTDEYYGPTVQWANNTAYKCRIGFSSSPAAWSCATGVGNVQYYNNLVYDSWQGAAFDQTYLTACGGLGAPVYASGHHNTWTQIVDSPYWEYNDTVDWAWTGKEDQFVLLDSASAVAEMLAPRKADNSLPDITFLTLAEGSDLINAGVDIGFDYEGDAPDIGYAESNYINIRKMSFGSGNKPRFKNGKPIFK